jgi:curli biogenesis system outer membrane secretion channel CsgG
MRSIAFILTLLSGVALFTACSGSKSYAKKASKLDQAGLYAEAAEMYLQSVQRSQKNVDAKIGLKKTGQMLLNDKLSEFFKFANMGTKADAVNSYLNAKLYQERVERLGVKLDIPDHYRTEFEKIKGEHLVELYNEGQALMEKQDFKNAEVVFASIARLEPNYKDASNLQAVAYLEPLYRTAKTDLEAGLYRKAYDGLSKVIEKDPSYKDASSMRNECLDKGKYSIAVLPFKNASSRPEMAPKVQEYAMTALTETKDPFIKLVDRENMDRILEEQRLGMSGVVDEQTAVRVGNLMGAQAVLMGTLIEYREEPGALRKSTKDGYESYRVKEKDPTTGEEMFVTRYKPVKYQEYYQENKVYVSFSYRLVSLETGEVLMSKVVDRQAEDHVYYANYEGNKDMLLPARNGVVDLADRGRRDLRGLLTAPRSLKPMTVLTNDLLRTSTLSVAGEIQQELNQKLP